MQFDVKIWGKVSWYFIHLTALKYNDDLKNSYIQFYEHFKYIIPCPICSTHFNNDISIPGNGLKENINTDKIFNWTIDLHNNINKMNNIKIYGYEEALKYYMENYNSKLINIFVLEIIHYNINEPNYKKKHLYEFLKCVCYIYPNEIKRKVLTRFTNKYPPNQKRLKYWILIFIIISDYDINKLKV